MLHIKKEIIRKIANAKQLSDLYFFLQKAIELEHSTIPPYLTAMMSLKFGKNAYAWDIIHSVVVEEMLHMTIAANILNAIGGAPFIDHPSFIPAYPCPLPMNIDNGLIVGLEKYSKTQLEVFMDIECPEDPLHFPERGRVSQGTSEVKTIGQFYQALKVKIEELAPQRLPGNEKRQVTSSFFKPDVLFPLLTKKDLKHAINVIVEQGEGTSKKPTDQTGEIAHYYRFEELVKGKKLDPEGDSFIFDKPIIIDENDVWPITSNTKSKDFPLGTQERKTIDDFNQIYTRLLKSLHLSFNGEPQNIDSGLGLMYDLKLAGQKLASMPNPNDTTKTLGPTFEYLAH